MGTSRTTANGFVTAGVDSSQGGRTPSPPERSTSTRTFADIFSTAAFQENRRRKTPSQQNKQFDPGGRGEKAPPWNAAVTLPFVSGGELGSSLLVFCLCFFVVAAAVCVCFPNLFFVSQVKLISEAAVLDADQVADVRNRRASIFSLIILLKLARTSNTRFGRSADTLE